MTFIPEKGFQNGPKLRILWQFERIKNKPKKVSENDQNTLVAVMEKLCPKNFSKRGLVILIQSLIQSLQSPYFLGTDF